MKTCQLIALTLITALLTACSRSDAQAPVAAVPPSATTPAVNSTATAAAALEPATFAFADDDAGRWLSEKLAPPAEMELGPIPPVTAPAPRRARASDAGVNDKLAALPQLQVTTEPHLLAVEQGISPRVAEDDLDLPTLQVAALFAPPALPALAAGPLTYVPSPGTDRPLPLAASPKVGDERPLASFDPTIHYQRAFALPIVTAGRAGLVPFQRFTIPNPFADQPAITSAPDAADLDAPVASISRPPAPVLK
ncbi:MAG: hypothetical protein WD768_11490 [Phycisphaeraceae bacterium]